MLMNKLVYNTREASKVLNIGLSKMYHLIKTNQIPYVKIGSKAIIPKKELMKWLKESTNSNWGIENERIPKKKKQNLSCSN